MSNANDKAREISLKVDEIIRLRKIKAEEIKRQREDILEIKRIANNERILKTISSVIQDEEIKSRCNAVITKAFMPLDLRKSLDNVVKLYDAAVARFERDSINIATVGRARQGKSVFLQSVSDLSNDIIPAYDAGDCTGAVSIISNDQSVEEGKVRVRLTFRTKEEAVQIVCNYIKAISPSYLEGNSISFDDIEYIPVDSFVVESGDVNSSVALKHLTKIVEAFRGDGIGATDSIKFLYGHSEMELTDPDVIKKYVAQNNGLSEDNPLREYYYNYLAVSKAEIFCKFRADVGKLVLIDTIGVGDTQYGIEDAMLDTVDNKCDAAIVMRKPDSGLRTEDIDLYNMLRKRFEQRDTSKWLFYIANLHKGRNDESVASYYNDVRKENFSIAGCAQLDCSDKNMVQNDFLLPTLDTLTANMDAIDGDYLRQLKAETDAFKAKFTAFVCSMPQIDAFGPSENVATYSMGVECYQKLTADLSRKVTEWYRKKDKANAVLWSQIKDILDNLEDVLPDEDEIQNVMDQAGDLIGDDIWKVPLNYVRNKITDQFIAIDKPMEEETLNFKNDIVESLYNTLKSLAGDDPEASQDEDHVKWLWNVLEPHIKDQPEYSQIYKALQFLNQFEFNVRAQIILDVRHQLGIINPMTPDLYMKPDHNFSKLDAGKAIKFFMTSRIAILEDGLRHSLSQINKMPNQAFYAAAEEVYDRLTFASDLDSGKIVNMSNVWGKFFTQFGPILFREHLAKYQQMNEFAQKYKEYKYDLADVLNRI